MTQRRVSLVTMPFGPVTSPSIALSLLRSVADGARWDARIHYFTANFARKIGVSGYSAISDGVPANHDLAGEFIFAHCVKGLHPSDAEEYVQQILKGGNRWHDKRRQNLRPVPETFLKTFHDARAAASEFVDECVESLAGAGPVIVGFTTVFQQNLASLAVAQRLKVRCPDVFIVFGGANCEGVMGEQLLASFDCLDAVVSGEGEEAFATLLEQFDCRRRGTRRVVSTPPRMDLDSLPEVSFDDYFQQCDAAQLELEGTQRLMFESARGCWWGAKHHCTFCGLNGGSMPFRSKSPERTVAELTALARKFPGMPISVVDNILDHRYLTTVLPELSRGEQKMRLFWEVKANLSKDQLRVMKAAGVEAIQPGIESLSDEVLALMRKGIKGIRNVQLLKWCLELGIQVEWNLLWGFPGERPEEYSRMAALVPLLTHLPPPHGGNPIRLDRFSPNFEEPELHGLTSIRHYPAYDSIYGLDDESVSRLAYFFTFEYAAPNTRVTDYTAPLAAAVKRWKRHHEASVLFFVDKEEQLLVFDLRDEVHISVWGLNRIERAVALALDAATTPAQAYARAAAETPMTVEQFDGALDRMICNGLVMRDGDYCLSLAVALTAAYCPPARALERLLAHGDRSAQPESGELEFALQTLSL